jgi:hypothetical protein
MVEMKFTYDNAVKWFEGYFKAFNKNAGPLKTVPNMEKFFTPDLEFWPYNMANTKRPLSREELLMTMVHPGLHEELTPRYYVVDEGQKIVVVQFQLQFNDEPSGTVFPPRQASAHYHLTLDENKNLKIKKILYFTEPRPPDEPNTLMELWRKYREKALSEQKI